MFKFKEFSIVQDKTAMKVCTDSCLFGAVIKVKQNQKILDIGTGTGLLALMLAQKNATNKITAVELDSEALINAKQNIENSKFKNQIDLIHDSIQSFATTQNRKFDLIVCNPPFYENNLKSPKNNKKNTAHHATDLSFEALTLAVTQLLSTNGELWILLPPYQMEQFKNSIEKNNLLVHYVINVKHNATKPIFRKIIKFKFEPPKLISTTDIEIYEENNTNYTESFVNLLRDYYLIF